jgi:hypothetical protein
VAQASESGAPYSPTRAKSFVAVFSQWVGVAKQPAGKPVFELQPSTLYAGQGLRLLVLDARDVAGERWLHVRLPAWHGIPSGWIRERKVKLVVNPWRVEVDRQSGILRVLREGKLVRTARVGTGTNETPTPRGLHAIYDHWRSDQAVLGEWTVSLTTQSRELPTFNGKRAIVAIHGWRSGNGTSGNVSHGCVRVPDSALMRMVALQLPNGTPVQVV